jgi:DNA helicase-2/ATP-dependent DNA helicase PcrA
VAARTPRDHGVTSGVADPLGDLLGDLTEAQRRAVTVEASPLCVLAGAGAGKTRVLTRRIAARLATGSASADHVLALTFTRKAAAEMAARLRALGVRDHVACGTFHAIAAAQLRRWWADRRRSEPVLLERPARIVAPLVAERPAFRGVPLAEVMGALGWARARDLDPDQVGTFRALDRPLPVPPDELAALLRRYRDEKRRRGLVDFDDLLSVCADAIRDDPSFAAAQRWRWRHLFVDEVQDLNPLQFRLLSAWLGDRRDLCVVGDPNQAIYGWNGADPGLLAELPRRWPTTEVVTLDVNHRCSPQVVAAAASVLGPAGRRLSSSRPDGPPVEVASYPDDTAEADATVDGLRAAQRSGRSWGDLAVLVRTNAQAVTIAARCAAEGVPARVPGRTRILEHPAARRALAELGERAGVPVAVAAADLAVAATAAAVATPLEGERAPTVDDEGAAVLATLADLAADTARTDPSTTVGGWIRSLPATLGDADPAGGRDAVTVCSFHRAKGLEWDSVWVCGLEAGLVPIGRASDPAALDEERRLLYVAFTRAGRCLHLSWAERRRFGDRLIPREPSPWLDAIGADAAPESGGSPTEPTSEEWRRRLAQQRAKLGRTRSRPGSAWRAAVLPPGWEPPDEAVLGALEDWRRATARVAAVPAHVVLHDSVLVALASARPRDEAGLLAIPGMGPVKVSRYGRELLRRVAGDEGPASCATMRGQ